MGVMPQVHGRGIGRGLMEACLAWCRERGILVLHVKTVAESAGDPGHLKTLGFYRAMGFLPLQVLPLWDARNPCQLLVRMV